MIMAKGGYSFTIYQIPPNQWLFRGLLYLLPFHLYYGHQKLLFPSILVRVTKASLRQTLGLSRKRVVIHIPIQCKYFCLGSFLIVTLDPESSNLQSSLHQSDDRKRNEDYMELLWVKSAQSSHHFYSYFVWNSHMATPYCRGAWEPWLNYVPKKKRAQILVRVGGFCHFLQGQVLHSFILIRNTNH